MNRKEFEKYIIWPRRRKTNRRMYRKDVMLFKRISCKYSERPLTSIKQNARIGVDDKPYRRCALFIENYQPVDKPTYILYFSFNYNVGDIKD
jgi:hypothetical protein